MDKTVEVTKVEVEESWKDQLVVTVLGAIASMVASKMVERGYFSVKARRVAMSNKTTK